MSHSLFDDGRAEVTDFNGKEGIFTLWLYQSVIVKTIKTLQHFILFLVRLSCVVVYIRSHNNKIPLG